VYQRVGAASGSSSFDDGSSIPATISHTQVTVTGPNGAVPVRCANCSGGYEELTLGGSVYTAIAHFDATDAGNYTVSVNGDGSRVAVALSVSGVAGDVLGSLVPLVIGGFLVFAAIIWAIILAVTGSRKKPLAAGTPGPTGYPVGYPATVDPAAQPGLADQPAQTPPVEPAVEVPSAVNPPAGWYPNPDNPAEKRWWTGSGWSDIVEKGP
nr:DUF2510 domain-containing protein [Actinomycetes bacterium]